MFKTYENILKKIIRALEDHFKTVHLNRVHTDMKCPNCNEWFSVSGIKYKHSLEKEPKHDFSICICGQCGFKSNWSPHIAPCLIRVDDNGIPITDT